MNNIKSIPWYPWLNTIYKNIINVLSSNNNHAFILCTPNGIGIVSLIYKIIQWLLCSSKTDNHICNICTNCILLNNQYHPDIHIIQKEKHQTSISITLIRQIINILYKNSYKDKGKIIWIPIAEELNQTSSNGILKILEEPPKNVWFFIQTQHINTLLPTIISRCQVWKIYPPNEQIGLHWLTTQNLISGIHKDEFLIALKICHYAPINAHKLLQNNLWSKRQSLYVTFVHALKYDIMELLLVLNNVNILILLDWISIFLIDVMKLFYKINIKFIYNIDQINILSQVTKIITIKKIILIINKVILYRKILMIDNINYELIITRLLVSLDKIKQTTS
ncbi:DNA polymerase III subunit delta' C-terminal domain-containing protein [Enterobacteriaceae endosymbiont of Macroplea appendiculata]|uniref:DNA polymerase III subunit delta' C-terminal domain-containing protein n=1 Tax=Enterobacteriaceae endosymbiont of Macroplea appendiculata TaxID=2675790 RepID=UPI0014493546|nr:DNA polymerase III subunit delta' C-terminal domain-containing protein [Enterobacteriaceae endosymbiont of Macroplea appendiculata]QJC30711.1 hypothetical protein GJT86_00430 [Enterobacteriaceae endosymbiont of Macroplea appendiculata]